MLNLLQAYDRRTVGAAERCTVTSESTATAFADRRAYIGDRKYIDVPLYELVSPAFAAQRACGFRPHQAQGRPIGFGPGRFVRRLPGEHHRPPGAARNGPVHLQPRRYDRWGDMAAYTLTIEQTGGSGITVPGYGFLLNNELTDFDFVPCRAGARPQPAPPGKRPRSSMSPTLVLQHGRPYLAVGSPGGLTIITTVAQVLLGYLDRRLPLVAGHRRPPAVLA